MRAAVDNGHAWSGVISAPHSLNHNVMLQSIPKVCYRIGNQEAQRYTEPIELPNEWFNGVVLMFCLSAIRTMVLSNARKYPALFKLDGRPFRRNEPKFDISDLPRKVNGNQPLRR